MFAGDTIADSYMAVLSTSIHEQHTTCIDKLLDIISEFSCIQPLPEPLKTELYHLCKKNELPTIPLTNNLQKDEALEEDTKTAL